MESRQSRTQRALTDTATRENAIAGQVLAERLDPPGYIRKELGERPRDPGKRRSWESGVRPSRATARSTASKTPTTLPPRCRPKRRASPPLARLQLRRIQKDLGRIKESARARGRGRSLGIGR